MRTQYGLENQCIVSLIGLTCSESLFFLETFEQLSTFSDEYAFLLVGGKPIKQRIEREATDLGIDVITPGWVDYEMIEDYFAATDVGLYPVDQSRYYDAASPIKIFEYTAAKVPVVSTNLDEVRHLNFPNVARSEPTPDGFRDTIIEVGQSEKYDKYPELNQYRWESIASTVEEIIQKVVE